MKIKTIAVNGIVAALYIAVSALIQPFGFTNVQFRVSEIFNHLIVFNKKFFYGIVLGVFLTNLFFSPMVAYDLVFGTGQSIGLPFLLTWLTTAAGELVVMIVGAPVMYWINQRVQFDKLMKKPISVSEKKMAQ